MLSRLRLRKDIRTLFANHSVCNASKLVAETGNQLSTADGNGSEEKSKDDTPTASEKKKAFLCKFMLLETSINTLSFGIHSLNYNASQKHESSLLHTMVSKNPHLHCVLELRQYKNGSIQSKKIRVLKLPLFFPRRTGDEKER